MHLIADRRGFSVHRTAGVLLVFQNTLHGAFVPAVDICRNGVACLSSYRMKVGGRDENFLPFQLLCNLRRAFSGKAEGEYLSDDLCRRLVDIPLLFVAFNLFVSIGDSRGDPLTLRGFQLIDRTDFLAGLRRIPLVENTVKWQHFHSFAGCGIDIFLYGDKGNAKGRIDHLRQPAHLDLLSSKTGYILYDDRPDLSVLRHSLHPLKIRPLKSRPGNAVVYKENRVQIAMFFSVVQ